MYVDRTYYLAPDGQVAADAFGVFREGMKGKIGIGKVALVRTRIPGGGEAARQRPRDVHPASRRRDPRHGRHRGARDDSDKVKPQEVQLAKQIIATFERKLDLTEYRDEYRDGLQKIIDAKISGEEFVAPSRRDAGEGREPDGRAQEESQ